MTNEDFNRQVRRTACLTAALVAFIVFGTIVLAEGDWLPGGLIVASALIGLVRQVPVIRKLCTRDLPARRRSKPAS